MSHAIVANEYKWVSDVHCILFWSVFGHKLMRIAHKSKEILQNDLTLCPNTQDSGLTFKSTLTTLTYYNKIFSLTMRAAYIQILSD